MTTLQEKEVIQVEKFEDMLKTICKLNIIRDTKEGTYKWQFFRFFGASGATLLSCLLDFIVWAIKAITAGWWLQHEIEDYIKDGETLDRFRRIVVAYMEAEAIYKQKE
jgi:hypothetical protein